MTVAFSLTENRTAYILFLFILGEQVRKHFIMKSYLASCCSNEKGEGNWWQHKTLASILLLGISILDSLESQITESNDARAWLGAAIYSSGAREGIQCALHHHCTWGRAHCGDIGNNPWLVLLYGKELLCSHNSLQELTQHRLHPPPSCRNKQLQNEDYWGHELV